MSSKYADAAFALMRAKKLRVMTSRALWASLVELRLDLTTKTEGKKTPRSTCFRDMRKDARFRVLAGNITLEKDG